MSQRALERVGQCFAQRWRMTCEDRFWIGRIAGFKIPRYMYFVTEWPMSSTKIQEFRLRELIARIDYIDPAKLA